MIRDFLAEHHLPGVVIDEPWRDFSFNRSFAINRLRELGSIDYGLMIDADNILHFEENFDAAAFKREMTHDYYEVTILHPPSSYRLPWMFSTRFPFRFRGILHEFMVIPSGLSGGIAHGIYSEQIQDSARNRNTNKYLDDAAVLENALTTEQDPMLVARYTFYLAQSYRDAKIPQRALTCYLRAAELAQWQEERFYSLYQVAHLMRDLGYQDEDVIRAYMQAQHAQPARAEAYHGAANFCRLKGHYARGVQMARLGLSIMRPEQGSSLFLEDWIYQYGLLDELAVNAYWAGFYQESRNACLKVLECPQLPESERPRILKNLGFTDQKIAETQGAAMPISTQPTLLNLARLLSPARLTHITDIGANPVDGKPPYQPMIDAGLCHVTGFEPQAEALEKLLASQGPRETYLPYAVGDGHEHTLHICEASGMTSCLEPDVEHLALFEPFKKWGTVIEKVPLSTRRLDEIAEIEHMDLLKIDIQGGELEVFRHGAEKLSKAVAVQVEISFVNLYKNQPGFGEIDIELRRQGLMPHGFAAVKNWALAPWTVSHVTPRTAQLLEADLVYVRDITRPCEIDSEALKHLALIAHYCYGSYDLALRCIDELEKRSAIQIGSVVDYRRQLGIQ